VKSHLFYLNTDDYPPLKVRVSLTQNLNAQHHFVPTLQSERNIAMRDVDNIFYI